MAAELNDGWIPIGGGSIGDSSLSQAESQIDTNAGNIGNVQSQDVYQEHLQEEGYPPIDPPEADFELPPGYGKSVLPHYVTFSSIMNFITRTYRWTYDAARKHSDVNAVAIRNDTNVMEALRTRQMPTAQLGWHIEPQNQQDQSEISAVSKITSILNTLPRFQQYRMHLLEALWFGRYGVANTFRWNYNTGHKRLVIADYRPVNGDKLVFKFSGQVGVLVHQQYGGSWQITDRGRAHFFTPAEREQLVIHKHEPEDADFFSGDMAGAIHGVGLRGRVYFLWWLKTQVMTWLMDYLERVGAGGFTIYFYEHGNPQSLNEVTAAAQTQRINNTILFPRYKDGSGGGPGIQRIEPSNAGANLLQALVSSYFDLAIRRYICGLSISLENKGLSIGSGESDLDASTFSRLVKYDAENLDGTITAELLPVLYKYNCPGVAVGRFKSDVEKPNVKGLLQAVKVFWEMGGTIDENEIRELIGISSPEPGHNVLARMAPVQPAGVGGVPTGVPMAGQPGPIPAASLTQLNQNKSGNGPLLFSASSLNGFSSDGQTATCFRCGSVLKSDGTETWCPRCTGPDRVRFGRSAAQSQTLGRSEPIHNLAKTYVESTLGVPYNPSDTYVSVMSDPARQQLGKRIADAYEHMEHAPHDPAVQRAYRALMDETAAQYQAIKRTGLKVEPIPQGAPNPYPNSRAMISDVRDKNHLWFFPTAHGFGDTPIDQQDNPLLEPTNERAGDHVMLANDLFRVVHDYFGHAKNGYSFGPDGEENAWRSHAAMYSPLARHAMTSETRGQNSWVNFGPHGEANRSNKANTVYAPQKIGLLPSWVMDTEPDKLRFAAAERYAMDLQPNYKPHRGGEMNHYGQWTAEHDLPNGHTVRMEVNYPGGRSAHAVAFAHLSPADEEGIRHESLDQLQVRNPFNTRTDRYPSVNTSPYFNGKQYSPLHVLGAANNLLDFYVRQHNPQSLYITAFGNKRQRIYTKLFQQLAQRHGYTILPQHNAEEIGLTKDPKVIESYQLRNPRKLGALSPEEDELTRQHSMSRYARQGEEEFADPDYNPLDLSHSEGGEHLNGVLTPNNQWLSGSANSTDHLRLMNEHRAQHGKPPLQSGYEEAILRLGYARLVHTTPTTVHVEVHRSRFPSVRYWIHHNTPSHVRNINYTVFGDDVTQPPRELNEHPEEYRARYTAEKIVQTGFKDQADGTVYPTGPVHDEGMLPQHLHNRSLEDVDAGFITSTGRFLTRDEAEQWLQNGSSRGSLGIGATHWDVGRNLLRRPRKRKYAAQLSLFGEPVAKPGKVKQVVDPSSFNTPGLNMPGAPDNLSLQQTSLSNKRRPDPNNPFHWLTVDEQAAYPTPADKKQIQHYFDVSTPVEEWPTVAKVGRVQRHWYRNGALFFHNILPSDRDAYTHAAVSAAFSPVTEPSRQVLKGLKAWEAWERWGRPRDPLRVAMMLNSVPEVMPANIPNAAKAFMHHREHGEPEYQDKGVFAPDLRAFKISTYARNQVGFPNLATNDTWMFRYANLPDAFVGKPHAQLALLAKERAAAWMLNREQAKKRDMGFGHAEPIEPWDVTQIQAAIWSVVRTLGTRWLGMPAEGIRGKPKERAMTTLNSLTHKDLYDQGDIARSVRDDPNIAKQLRQMGLADAHENVKRLFAELPVPSRQLLSRPAIEGIGWNWGPTVARLKRRILSKQPGSSKPEPGRVDKVMFNRSQYGPARKLTNLSDTVRPIHSTALSPTPARQLNLSSGFPLSRVDTGRTGTAYNQRTLARLGRLEQTASPTQTESSLFLSPNTDNLTFEQAMNRFRSGNQATFRQLASQLGQQLGLPHLTQLDAVGDWGQSAENALLLKFPGTADPGKVEYLGAWLGLMANQRSVYAFHAHPQGPDSVYQISSPERDTARIRTQLDQYGLHERTLVPTPSGHLVVLLDRGRTLKPRVEQFLESTNATASEATGNAVDLGSGATRTAARAKYRERIRQYESALGGNQTPGSNPGTGQQP